MEKIEEKLPDDAIENLKKKKQPDWISPMLATLTHDHFSDENWIYERKLDGERCVVYRDGKDLRLMSRNKKVINDQYPELAEAFKKQPGKHFIVDGEIVAFEGKVTSFSRLQKRMHVTDPKEIEKSGVAVYYYVFDILYVDRYELTDIALRHRKAILRRALDFDDPIRFLTHRNEEGLKFYREACRKGWEGLIAKDARSRYVRKRSKKWLKFKCVHQQEFVIGGYTDPEGERIGFGSLLLGYYKDDQLKYAGKVGTGFDDEMLKMLHGRMKKIEKKKPPFDIGKLPSKGVHWIKPKLVGEVGFTEWTGDGRLRHPRFLGLRDDKRAKDVVREDTGK